MQFPATRDVCMKSLLNSENCKCILKIFQNFMNNLFDFISQKCTGAVSKTILLIPSSGTVSILKQARSKPFAVKMCALELNLRFNGISVRPAISIIENHSNIITENKMIFDQDNGRPNSNCN